MCYFFWVKELNKSVLLVSLPEILVHAISNLYQKLNNLRAICAQQELKQKAFCKNIIKNYWFALYSNFPHYDLIYNLTKYILCNKKKVSHLSPTLDDENDPYISLTSILATQRFCQRKNEPRERKLFYFLNKQILNVIKKSKDVYLYPKKLIYLLNLRINKIVA